MKHCDKCQVDINTNQEYCPLCHQTLQGENDPDFIEFYPEYVPLRQEVLPLTKKVLFFLTIVSILTLIVINVLTWKNNENIWSLIPIGSILYFWLIVRYGVLSKQNIAFKFFLLTTGLVLILNLIDRVHGVEETRGWALDYVTPLAFLACNLAISVIIWVRKINYRDYIFYLITIKVFSLIPIILALTGIIKVIWPAVAAFGAAIFILLFIIFFFPRSIKDEIKKRFHL